jgi:shikimate kinase
MKSPDACISIVGMPTSGKTTLGMRLAKVLERHFTDSDRFFEAALGTTIAEYVTKSGWPSFRTHEEEIIRGAIAPDVVVSLGGGAIESAKTRSILVAQTRVIWIRAELQTILDRWSRQQAGQGRPQLTGLSVEQETREKYERRHPLFENVADVVVNAEDTIEQQIGEIRSRFGL